MEVVTAGWLRCSRRRLVPGGARHTLSRCGWTSSSEHCTTRLTRLRMSERELKRNLLFVHVCLLLSLCGHCVAAIVFRRRQCLERSASRCLRSQVVNSFPLPRLGAGDASVRSGAGVPAATEN